MLLNKKSNCIRSETCENIRFTTTYKQESQNGNTSEVFVVFENPEVEYRNTYISYDLLNFIGEVGGILGLTLGASIMALFDSIFKRIPYY